jgi:hypothetical protein
VIIMKSLMVFKTSYLPKQPVLPFSHLSQR